ncbi:MAG TPA: hypothetical protein PL110_05925 [Candidatus Eremiobacteraeota bacterium]|nr:MAG: hypothetical protein BWY64_01050 [bacterium ADurb.Bin363]HPZ07631.1 hypothetical protein [Candidatus Eremiobacteraeota bacterium]
MRRIYVFFLFFFILSSSVYGETGKIEKELAGIKLGLSRADVINLLGKPEGETLIIGPRTFLVYDFMDYTSQGILLVLRDGSVSFINIFFPCMAKTAKGIAIGDNLSDVKNLYGSSVKISIGYASIFTFPEYNISVKGLKGTIVITEIILGKFEIY